MREQEMRMRVFGFLKARMRNMIMPATVGIGLAVGGCAKNDAIPIYSAPLEDSGLPAQTDVRPSSDGPPAPPDSAAPRPDSAGIGPDSSASLPDLAIDAREVQVAADLAADTARDLGGRDLGRAETPVGDVPTKPDQAVAIDGGGADAEADLGNIVTKYIAPMPDGAAEGPIVVPLYTAVMPDAGAGPDGLAVRYMAVMPDGPTAAPMYMASQPS